MVPKLSDYEEIVGTEMIEELKRLAEGLQGLSLIHVNSTREGGGVAEMLHRLVPLFNELGIGTRWEVIEGTPLFFRTTKSIHNALQGGEVELTEEMEEEYRRVNRENAEKLNLNADIVVIHDPQPAALIEHRPPGGSRWVWRCHIDPSRPDEGVWRFLESFIEGYDVAVFSTPEFIIGKHLPLLLAIIPPSIDPLSDKNRELSQEEVEQVYERYGVPRDKPILLQVSRFDKFKDPIGVIRAYRLVKREIDCRLVLAGGMASDDPEGSLVMAQVREEAAGDPDIHLLPPPPQVKLSDLEINALQQGADVIIQKSLKEGFALVVAEALWKGKPVVATAVGGIKLQVIDGETGFLVNSIEETAARVKYLLDNPEVARRLGKMGREHVRQHFLITRHLRDYLKLFSIIAPR
jgi:trehalose synthase